MDYTKYTEDNRYPSLLKTLVPPERYRFGCGIGCTYSANTRTFEALEKALGITRARDPSVRIGFHKGESFRLYVQQGKCDIVHNAVKAVNPGKGVLHAKVYAIKYAAVTGNAALYRVVVTSANLTNASELNICAVFDSEDTADQKNTDFGESVSSFFRTHFSAGSKGTDGAAISAIPEKVAALLEELSYVYFGKDARFLDVKESTLTEKMRNDARSADAVTIFSPFLKEEFFTALGVPQQSDKSPVCRLVSRPDQMDACANGLKGFQCYTFGTTDQVINAGADDTGDSEIPRPNTLHAKIYLFHQKPSDETVTYLGSANATDTAFGKNIEALVCFREDGNKCCLDAEEQTMYVHYEPPKASSKPDDPDDSLSRFEAKCLQIIQSFRANETVHVGNEAGLAYAINIPSGYTVTAKCGKLEAKQNGHCQWRRDNPLPHIVTLSVAGDKHRKTITLLADGIPDETGVPRSLPVEAFLGQSVRQAWLDYLAKDTSDAAKASGNTGKRSGGKGRSPQPLRKQNLAEILADQDTQADIQLTCRKCGEWLEQGEPSKSEKQVLEQFRRDCFPAFCAGCKDYKACKQAREEAQKA